jgi:hypothetical protein
LWRSCDEGGLNAYVNAAIHSLNREPLHTRCPTDIERWLGVRSLQSRCQIVALLEHLGENLRVQLSSVLLLVSKCLHL